MTRTQATLKTLVQCRAMWFWHFCSICLAFAVYLRPFIVSDTREATVFTMLVFSLWIGVMAASVFKDFMSRPFSFVVPSHQLVWRRVLFAIGLAIALVSAFVFVLVETDANVFWLTPAWQVFLLSLACFQAGILLVNASSNMSFLPGVVTLVLVIAFDQDVSGPLRVNVGRFLLSNAAAIIPICLGVIAFAWKSLGTRSLGRRLCGNAFLPLHSIWSGSRQAAYIAERKFKRLRTSPGKLAVAVERFFLARIRSSTDHSVRATLWGTLYAMMGRAAPVRASNLLTLGFIFTVITVLLGFYRTQSMPAYVSGANLMLFVLCAVSAEYSVNPFSSLILNVSRKNRFRSLLLASAVQLCVVTLASTLLILISIGAGSFLHEITFRGATITYAPIIPKSFFYFAAMLPFLFVGQILFPKNSVIFITFISIVAITAFVGNADRFLGLSVLGIAGFHLVFWLPFVLLVRHYCLSRDLKLGGQ
jgi:hypothetical protein